MDKEIVEKTRRTAGLYFQGVRDEKPYDLWKAFDPKLARDFSLFILRRLRPMAEQVLAPLAGKIIQMNIAVG